MGKRITFGLVAALLLLLIGYGVYRGIFRGPTDPRVTPTPLALETPRIVVESVAGTAERLTGTTWSPLAAGDELAEDEQVRTGPSASVRIAVGTVSRVELAAETRVRLDTVTRTLSRVRVGEGRINARVVSQGESTLAISVEGSDAVAGATDAAFSVLTDGKGHVTVAADEGEVDLTAADENVKIGAGQQSVVLPNRAPSAPAEIPTSLYLKISQMPRQTAQQNVVVRGKTSPGAMVSVNDVDVAAGADGVFKTTVALSEGPNRVQINVVDVTGREESETVTTTVDTKSPQVTSTVNWD